MPGLKYTAIMGSDFLLLLFVLGGSLFCLIVCFWLQVLYIFLSSLVKIDVGISGIFRCARARVSARKRTEEGVGQEAGNLLLAERQFH